MTRLVGKMSIMNEKELAKLLRHDFSVGTEAFAEDLLERALAVLDEEEDSFSLVDEGEGFELSDEQLDMLSAAGPMTTPMFDNQNGSWK